MKPDRPLSITKASDYLGIHHNTLRKWADAGRVPTMMTVRVLGDLGVTGEAGS